MPSWRGNPINPVPNPVQASIARSEKRIDENRSYSIRRDTDKKKNETISLQDIDETIAEHFKSMRLIVEDDGNVLKIPVIYGSMEKWVSAKRDGYLRDNQGKIQFPVLIFQKTNVENNDDIEIFNRYVKYPVIVKNSIKNKYTQFSVLTGKNVPVNEVYYVTMPDHVILTYQCMMWAEYTPHINKVIETLKFNTKDYWGSKQGFKFKVQAESFNITQEVLQDDDRVVKLEWNLTTTGYILPESYQLLDRQHQTTEKTFTPKKIIIGADAVSSDFNMNSPDSNSEWKSKKYPNLDTGEEPDPPPVTYQESGSLNSQ